MRPTVQSLQAHVCAHMEESRIRCKLEDADVNRAVRKSTFIVCCKRLSFESPLSTGATHGVGDCSLAEGGGRRSLESPEIPATHTPYFAAICMPFCPNCTRPLVLGHARVCRLWKVSREERNLPTQLWGSCRPCWGETFSSEAALGSPHSSRSPSSVLCKLAQ